MQPVLLVAIVLLFASSIVVDGLVHAVTHAMRGSMRLADELAHRPVKYRTAGTRFTLRPPPARSVIVR